MSKDNWENGRNALEEEFFARYNKELTDKLRAERSQEEACLELERLSSIHDKALLHKLYAAKMRPASFMALTLVPLVRVAWADGTLDDDERKAILQAAAEQGIIPGEASYELLESWFVSPPGEALFESWQDYVSSLKKTLDPQSIKQLETLLMNRIQLVAKAAGGFLGVGPKISSAEKQEIERLRKSF